MEAAAVSRSAIAALPWRLGAQPVLSSVVKPVPVDEAVGAVVTVDDRPGDVSLRLDVGDGHQCGYHGVGREQRGGH
eukprot:320045-Prymnesium_polylepis.1